MVGFLISCSIMSSCRYHRDYHPAGSHVCSFPTSFGSNNLYKSLINVHRGKDRLCQVSLKQLKAHAGQLELGMSLSGTVFASMLLDKFWWFQLYTCVYCILTILCAGAHIFKLGVHTLGRLLNTNDTSLFPVLFEGPARARVLAKRMYCHVGNVWLPRRCSTFLKYFATLPLCHLSSCSLVVSSSRISEGATLCHSPNMFHCHSV